MLKQKKLHVPKTHKMYTLFKTSQNYKVITNTSNINKQARLAIVISFSFILQEVCPF